MTVGWSCLWLPASLADVKVSPRCLQCLGNPSERIGSTGVLSSDFMFSVMGFHGQLCLHIFHPHILDLVIVLGEVTGSHYNLRTLSYHTALTNVEAQTSVHYTTDKEEAFLTTRLTKGSDTLIFALFTHCTTFIESI